jgi:hypothetical protein
MLNITPFLFSPKGRSERIKIALWAILVKEPVCRGGSFPPGGRPGRGFYENIIDKQLVTKL